MGNKYEPIALPKTAEEADQLAKERETWAEEAFRNDRIGSWREFTLTVNLLRNLEKSLK